jgi:alpha-glucosidase
VGEYVVVARRAAGGDWYVGAMTNWTARQLSVDLSFLDDGAYRMDVWQDGPNASRFAEDYKKFTMNVRKGDKVNLNLAPGGGWVARIHR